MKDEKLCVAQAAYCAALLHRVRDPLRKALLEREHHDWLSLAAQRRVRHLRALAIARP